VRLGELQRTLSEGTKEEKVTGRGARGEKKRTDHGENREKKACGQKSATDKVKRGRSGFPTTDAGEKKKWVSGQLAAGTTKHVNGTGGGEKNEPQGKGKSWTAAETSRTVNHS